MDAPHHRKIDLQSPSDLTYLLSNMKAAAREKIDLAIPPSAAPAGEDAYRIKVEELVNEYILQTLTLALPSLNINGLEASPSILRPAPTAAATNNNANTNKTSPSSTTTIIAPSPTPSEISSHTYEPYDPRLAEKLRQLYSTFDDESTKVAELRREAPAAAARAYREAVEAELKREREALEGMKRKRREEEESVGGGQRQQQQQRGEGEGGLELGLGLERRDEVEKMWEIGMQGLSGLGGVTGVLARLERAEKALGVVEGV